MQEETLDDLFEKQLDQYFHKELDDCNSYIENSRDKAHAFFRKYSVLCYSPQLLRDNRTTSVVIALIKEDYLISTPLKTIIFDLRKSYLNGIPLSTDISILNKPWMKDFMMSDPSEYRETGVVDISKYTDDDILGAFLRFQTREKMYLELTKKRDYYLDKDGRELTTVEMADISKKLHEDINVEAITADGLEEDNKSRKLQYSTAQIVLLFRYIFMKCGIKVENGNYSPLARLIQSVSGKDRGKIKEFVISPLQKDGRKALEDFQKIQKLLDAIPYLGFDDFIREDRKGL